ncbi:MAG: OmpH family outer membrane protein [Paracoccaceae bacterium]|nr:OmpH family outer membrane protein [Paracoccaceae bacterium]
MAVRWSRRQALFALGLTTVVQPVSVALAQSALILAVSRKRVLRDTSHARLLNQAETELTAELQSRVDAVKAELNAEEQELARLRGTLDRSDFARRVAEFDERVRNERRMAQQHAKNLQSALRAERLKLVEALTPLLEAVRVDSGAQIIVNTDQLLAADPAIDVTAQVIERFNAEVPPPSILNLDALAPERPFDPALDEAQQ